MRHVTFVDTKCGKESDKKGEEICFWARKKYAHLKIKTRLFTLEFLGAVLAPKPTFGQSGPGSDGWSADGC